ncbi:MAG: GntR family transcriptional regulator [Chitinivibrionales bacterium]|nr:GntR family transcriptional regulator [Chitinivibrionales bacterium]
MAPRTQSGAARAFLSGFIAERVAGQRLPSLQVMAFEAGVSLVTMHKAVRQACREGVVHSVPGKGVFAGEKGECGPAVTVAPTPAHRWQRIRARIEADMLGGQFGESALPGTAELGQRYGACYRTVRKALRSLQSEGLLEVRRKRYVQTRRHFHRPTARVVLISRRYTSDNPLPAQTRYAHANWFFEQECLLRNIVLQKVQYRYRGDCLVCDRASKRLLDGPGLENVLGYVLITSGLREMDFENLLRTLDRRQKPVVIHDPDGFVGPHRRIVRFYGSDSATAGAHVAHYLLQAGHRRVCYIAPRQDMLWSRQRLKGFVRAFERGGSGASVEVFADGSAFEPLLSERVQQIRNEVLERGIQPDEPDHLTFERVLRTMAPQISVATVQHELSSRTVPLIARAVADGRASALVAENDTCATACLQWMLAHRVRCPGEYSLVSFDDSYEAFANGLTSYNFNLTSVYQGMLNVLLAPSRDDRRAAREYRYDGMMMVRMTG